MDHSSGQHENLDELQITEHKEVYQERPMLHRIVSWFLIVVVLFAFLGTCYWLAFYGR